MKKIIEKLKNKIIVSSQASAKEPMYEEKCMLAMIQSVINGGAGGLRLAGARDIKNAKAITDIPIIGLTKPEPLPENWKEIVYITPTIKDCELLVRANADIIAIDGTSRKRPKENLLEQIEYIHSISKVCMVDISTTEEGIACSLLGADLISTTLSGYTEETLEKDNGEPDFGLLEKLVKSVATPVIMEGRIWTQEQVAKAFELGAYAVVIGSAITRPQLITKRFLEGIKK